MLQTTVRGVTCRIDAALISSFIRTDPVPLEGVPFPDFVDPPSMEELVEFFDPHHRAQDRVPQSIRIGLFSSSHRLLAKIVQYNLWRIARRSEILVCPDPADTILPLQAHCTYHTRDSRQALDKSSICVLSHEDLHTFCT